MNEIRCQDMQVGEWPSHDSDVPVSTNKHLSEKIRRKVLEGQYTAETQAETKMVREHKASGLSVDAFLKTYTQ